MSKFHPLPVAQRRARDARRRRDHVRRAATLARSVPLRAGPASDAARRHRRRRTCAARTRSARRAGRRAAHRGQAQCPGGVFSTWANEPLKAGDTLDVMPPLGHFNVAARPGARAALRRRSPPAAASRRCCRSSRRRSRPSRQPQFTLFYGNRASGTVMFKEELAALKDTYLDALQPRPRAVARGAGHRAPARPHRSREGRRAARALASISTTSTSCSSAGRTA